MTLSAKVNISSITAPMIMPIEPSRYSQKGAQ